MNNNKSKHTAKKFMSNYEKALENPLIKNFLEVKDNYELVKNTLNYPTPQKIKEVDEVFKNYFYNVKMLSYISKLIHFFSIDYDKTINKFQDRFLLILDQPINQDGESNLTTKDIIESPEYTSLDSIYGSSLLDYIQNHELHSALLLLTKKQLEILELIYYKNFQLTEIAEIKNTTPQNISNQHRRALRALRNTIVKKERNFL